MSYVGQIRFFCESQKNISFLIMDTSAQVKNSRIMKKFVYLHGFTIFLFFREKKYYFVCFDFRKNFKKKLRLIIEE